MKTAVTQSFSKRLSLYISLLAGVLFAVLIVLGKYIGDKWERQDAVMHAQEQVLDVNQEINYTLAAIETSLMNMQWAVELFKNQPDSMRAITHRLIETNSYIQNAVIAFEPNFYPQKGRYFAVCSFRDGGEVRDKPLGGANYDYFHLPWYQEPLKRNDDVWIGPYLDTDSKDDMLTSYSLPLRDSSGHIYAVFSADVSLQWLTQLVNNVKLYDHAYCMVLGPAGEFIVHPDSSQVFHETFFTAPHIVDNAEMQAVGREMIAQHSGYSLLHYQGEDCFVFYDPIPASGWSTAIVCPKDAAMHHSTTIALWLVLALLLGLVTLVTLCYWLLRRLTRPLVAFSQAAQQIASGDFNTPLPVIQSNDEMKTLHDSFDHMQHSLVSYIEDLKDATIKQERMQGELRVAHDIQMGMVPKAFPQRADVDIYAAMTPAREVGGDLYDFLIHDEKLFFIIGDVAGNGVPAALVMTVVKTLFHTLADKIDDVALIVTDLNHALMQDHTDMFVTLLVGIVDLQSGQVSYCNAGHCPPLVIGDGAAIWLPVVPNLPIGIVADYAYQAQTATLSLHSTLLLYTDGITEAQNQRGEFYGEQRLIDTAAQLADDKSARQIVDAVTASAQCFMQGSAQQHDDLTLLAIKR